MVEKSNQKVFLIQIDVSNFAEFEISEFEISRVVCRLITRVTSAEKYALYSIKTNPYSTQSSVTSFLHSFMKMKQHIKFFKYKFKSEATNF